MTRFDIATVNLARIIVIGMVATILLAPAYVFMRHCRIAALDGDVHGICWGLTQFDPFPTAIHPYQW